MVFGSFASLFPTKLRFSHKVLSKGKFGGVGGSAVSSLSWISCLPCIFHLHPALPASWKRIFFFTKKRAVICIMSCCGVSQNRLKLFHHDEQSCQHQRRHQMHISHTSPSQKLLMAHTRTRCDVSCAQGRVGKISALTDILGGWCQRYVAKYVQYDVTNQNTNPRTAWELICLGEGGPQLANPEVRIITPEVETPLTRQRREVDQEASPARHLEAIGPPARWPRGHIPDILPSDSSIYKGQMSSSQPVWRNEGIFEAIVSTCRLTAVWTAVSHRELLPRSSFSRSPEVYLDFSSLSEGEIILGPAGPAAWTLKAKPLLYVSIDLTQSH